MTTNEITFDILSGIRRGWDTHVRPYVKSNSCVLASRVAHEVLTYFGVAHEVLPTMAIAMNSLMKQHYMDSLHHSLWSPEAWSVAVGFPNAVALRQDSREPQGFDGHLVVATSQFYLDLSASQFDRPERSIKTGGSLLFNHDTITRFQFPKEDFYWNYFPIDEGSFFFRLLSGNDSYKNSPDWRTNYKSFAGDIIRSIRDEQKSLLFSTKS